MAERRPPRQFYLERHAHQHHARDVRLSDLDHPAGTPVYPSRDQMHAYLERYAAEFDPIRRIRLQTRVEALDRTPDGRWNLRSATAQDRRQEVFTNVVVASGPHTAGHVPGVPGIESFTGALGVAHTAQYEGADRYRGRSVVVAGCSISALEIASDLALGGARVTSTYRRQRYVLPKSIAGVPTDHVIFSRASALAAEIAPPEVLAQNLKSLIVNANGSPEQYGALVPNENVFAAGITQSQHFLPAVAEGKIVVRPWIDRIEGRTVHFSEGRAEADAILFGTGYRLTLPWLAAEIAETLGINGDGLDLHGETFHPDLEGLAGSTIRSDLTSPSWNCRPAGSLAYLPAWSRCPRLKKWPRGGNEPGAAAAQAGPPDEPFRSVPRTQARRGTRSRPLA